MLFTKLLVMQNTTWRLGPLNCFQSFLMPDVVFMWRFKPGVTFLSELLCYLVVWVFKLPEFWMMCTWKWHWNFATIYIDIVLEYFCIFKTTLHKNSLVTSYHKIRVLYRFYLQVGYWKFRFRCVCVFIPADETVITQMCVACVYADAYDNISLRTVLVVKDFIQH